MDTVFDYQFIPKDYKSMTGNSGREEVGLVGLGGGNSAGTGGPEVMVGGKIQRREVGDPSNSILTTYANPGNQAGSREVLKGLPQGPGIPPAF